MCAENISAVLAFEDGSVFRGYGFGAKKTVLGEGVFNTSMTGYQEIITDPSYYRQIITMTAPQIGNYGINRQDNESQTPKASGFVIRELSPITSNWRSQLSLDEYLKQNDIPGIQGVDTRAITKKLREAGVLKACLSTEGISDDEAVKQARNWEGFEGEDIVKDVTCDKIHTFDSCPTEHKPFTVNGTNLRCKPETRKPYHVAAIDYGAKRSIFLKLRHHGFKVTVVPADTSFEAIEELKPDCIFLSNGPGDPSALKYAHETVAKILPKYPTFGICMGHQIISHALGAKTFKLKYGHRGGNQPVKSLQTGKVSITAQNHGYASNPEDLEAVGAVVTEINLNDGTVAGLEHKKWPVFSVQYHPEAAPGPNDADPLFEKFYNLVEQSKKNSASV